VRIDVAFTPGEAEDASVAIVIDVLRATTTIAYALAQGYQRVLACGEIDQARALAERVNGGAVLADESVGKDLVAHCVNDILVQGAAPLFFMDYIATGKMVPKVIAKLVEGLAEGCREAGCALLGGETAEMPGFYQEGEYDLAGFILGVVEKSRMIDGKSIRQGHVILGLPSAGLHTNGYSLARKLLLETGLYTIKSRIRGFNQTVGRTLLAPHLNYFSILKPLIDQNLVRGMAHITGGGLTENIPRILPSHCTAHLHIGSWPALPIFALLRELGQVEQAEMFRVFNMGIGMVVIVAPKDLPVVQRHFRSHRQAHYSIGEIQSGRPQVVYES
jgi:phosphoribosylformylglycinamidine cyclo-ligase